MKTIDNKFEIGEECYTYARENVEVVCPVCKGTKKILYSGYGIPCKQCNTTGKIVCKQSMGLGNLVIGIIYDAMYGDKKDYYAKALDFPQNYEFAIAFAVGHKNTEKEPHEFDFDNSVSFI